MLLDDIVAATKVAVAERQRRVSVDELIRQSGKRAPALDFATVISGDGVKIIAEVKKASPSKGIIKADFEPVAMARAYARGGAAAISVLTEEVYFQGSLGYLEAIADGLGENRPPLLRKDFIIDAYQVNEARAYGADAVLLIAAIVSTAELGALLELADRLGMAALVETHNEMEVAKAVGCGARIIGINNRDLRTFNVNIETTAKLRPLIPAGRIVVSESGISSRHGIEFLKSLNINAALIGEALVKAEDAAVKLKELLS